MGKLTAEQRNEIRKFLITQGLSFKPLQDEMFDHIVSDLEYRMSNGDSFNDAWMQCVSEIPDNHFLTIQKDVMETINKGFTLTQWFSFSALALLFISSLFKVLHLQFAGEVLLLSFVFIAAALLTTAIGGISLNKKKKGSTILLAVVTGIIILLTGYGFKILHLPGADAIVITAVGLLIIALIANTLYVYQHATGEGNLLTFLHEKYTPGIERFLLFLLIPLIIYKTVTIVLQQDSFPGNMVLLVVMFGSGLQLIALSWRITEKDLSKRNLLTVTLIIVSCLCLNLPFLGPLLSIGMRIMVIILFSTAAAWLAYKMDEEKKLPSLIMACLVPVIFLGWGLIKLSIIPASAHAIFFNLLVLSILIIGLFLCRKHGTMRTYMLVSLSSYLFEYML